MSVTKVEIEVFREPIVLEEVTPEERRQDSRKRSLVLRQAASEDIYFLPC